MKEKIVTEKELVEKIQLFKSEGKIIIATGGCFDILHAGHVQYLEGAKALGDILVVFLNTDNSVKAIKGERRPIVSEMERAEVLSGLGCVDYVCLFPETDPSRCIARIQPDIWVKGEDYKGKDIPERDVVTAYGGRIEYAGLREGCSSTDIIHRINSQPEDQER